MNARPVLCLVPLALIVAGCGGGKQGPSKTAASTATATVETTTTATAPTETDAAGCTMVKAPAPKGEGTLKKPTLALSPAKTNTVTLQTNCGAIVIALDVKRAPKTASSFASLAKSGFYDGLTFHRIVADFVIQGGDPQGNGQGGPGYSVVEKPPSSLTYTRGVVAMAKTGVEPPGASGSQFFIVTGQNVGLPPEYALVGRVTSGLAAVNRIAAEPVNAESFPLNPVVIESATLGS